MCFKRALITYQIFQVVLGKVNRTGNQDKVEGLFDGLMQVMVCGVSIHVDILCNNINTFFIKNGNITIPHLLAFCNFYLFSKLTSFMTDACIFTILTLYRIRLAGGKKLDG